MMDWLRGYFDLRLSSSELVLKMFDATCHIHFVSYFLSCDWLRAVAVLQRQRCYGGNIAFSVSADFQRTYLDLLRLDFQRGNNAMLALDERSVSHRMELA